MSQTGAYVGLRHTYTSAIRLAEFQSWPFWSLVARGQTGSFSLNESEVLRGKLYVRTHAGVMCDIAKRFLHNTGIIPLYSGTRTCRPLLPFLRHQRRLRRHVARHGQRDGL